MVADTLSLAGGTASLTVQNGGTVTAGEVAMGTGATPSRDADRHGGRIDALIDRLRALGRFPTPGGTATLNAAAGGSVSAGGVLTLFGGGTVNVNAGSLAVGGLAHGTAASIGNMNLSNSGSLSITHGLGATYAGVIGGAGSLTKSGAGTQTLTGANTYTERRMSMPARSS